MKIKRVDILGFKSFHDRVSLDFQQGVTGIVGPNGCGKSNVVDAIRWVMGEQSAKNLRGKQMEDIIFAGSESRKPLGFAEVSLVFSTDDGRVSAKYLSYNEIQVTRRLYRNGESEYLLNKSQCRLMDIAELFMDTGVGARAYSIIEQGKIGMILHSKPEDRRVLIEEAAGVTKYKARKQVALKKIEMTRLNLVRISDVLSEIKRQLGGLQRQAKKAEKFRDLREELRRIQLELSVRQFLYFQADKTVVDEELVLLNARLASTISQQENAELSFEGRKLELLQHEKNLSLIQEELYSLKAIIQKGEGKSEYTKRELDGVARLSTRLEEEMERKRQQLIEAEQEQDSLSIHRGDFSDELENEEQELAMIETRLDELLRCEKREAEIVDEAKKEFFEVLSQIAQLKNRESAAAKRLDATVDRIERNKRENFLLLEKQVAVHLHIEELEKVFGKLLEDKNIFVAEIARLKEVEDELKLSLTAKEAELTVKRHELTSKDSRLKSFQELEAQLAGYGQGVRTLLVNNRFKPLFRAMVADIIDTTEKYEPAVEAALGEKLQWLLCDREQDAFDAMAHLKEVGGGRCSFILQGGQQSMGGGTPVADRLVTKLNIRPGCEDYVELLMAGTFIVEGLEEALCLGRQYPQLTFVTLQGELVHSGGIIHGGSFEAASRGIITKKREIKELGQQVGALAIEVNELEDGTSSLKSDVDLLEKKRGELRQKLHQMEIEIVNLEKDLASARSEGLRAEEAAAIKGMEDEQLLEEKVLLENEISDCNHKWSYLDERKATFDHRVNELQQNLVAQKEEIHDARELVMAKKVKVAALKEKQESNARSLCKIKETITLLRKQMEGHGVELHRLGEEREKLRLSLEQNDESLKGHLISLSKKGDIFKKVKEDYESEANKLQEQEEILKQLRTQAGDIRDAIATTNMKATQFSLQLQHVEHQLLEKFDLDVKCIIGQYKDTHADFDEAEIQRRQGELQAQVQELGDVNLTAIDEYEDLEKRYQFLTEQKNDLEESLRALQKAIQRINKTTRRRFLETFQLVNTKFQEIFPRLFCGGRAELKLTNEDDLLETGLDIVVQPPGKKLQNVTLLSGGEKALSAVALIFSIFLIKPTPFCLLDEVDAPLDDANIGRFNEMVKEMSALSQFIIITHNKATMAMVDTLYGVTMEEPGVSKLVSVKLH